ncbi:MAG: Ig-like domain-containing protein [Trueperaceae bacterium]
MPVSRLATAATFLLLALVACATSAVDPDQGFLEIRPGSFILTGAGDAVTLTASRIDSSGAAVEVDVSWHSSAPEVVAVSSAGIAVATGGVGSALITASSDGLTSNPVLAIVATPVAGARLVQDDEVLEGPVAVDPDAELDVGWRHRAVIAGGVDLTLGDLLIGTGEITIGGRVVELEPVAGGTLATLEVVPLDELFVALVIDQTVDLSDVRLEVDGELLDDYRVRYLNDGSVEFVPRVPATTVATAQATGGTANIGPFECGTSGALTLTLAATPTFSITPRFGLVIDYDLEDGGLRRLGVNGSLSSAFAIEPKVVAALAGSWKCERNLGVIPLPLGGPIAFVVGGQIPLGAGFEFGAELVLGDAGFKVEAQGSASVEMGLACVAGDCDGYAEGTGTFSANVTPNFPDFGTDGRVKASIKPYAYADLAVGTRSFSRFRMQVARLELAAEQAFDLATARAQALDTAYASTFDLKLTLKASLGSGISRAMRLLRVTIKPFSMELVSLPLARSPRGAFSITPDSVSVGDTTTFHVTLDPITYLLARAVGAIEIRRLQGDTLAPAPEGCSDISVSAGQSTVTCDYETEESDTGTTTYLAFVRPNLFGVTLPIPLEVAADSRATLTVGDGSCAGTERYVLQASNPPQDDGEVVANFGSMGVMLSTNGSLYVESLDHLCLEPSDASRVDDVVTVRMRVQGDLAATGTGEALVWLSPFSFTRFTQNGSGSFDEVIEHEVQLGRWFPLLADVEVRIGFEGGSGRAYLDYGIEGVVDGDGPVAIDRIVAASGTTY